MVKKQKEETPNVNATANRDVVQRLNFLYQASIYLQSTASVQQKGKGRPIDQIVDEDVRHNSTSAGSSSFKETSVREELPSVARMKHRRKIFTKDTGDLARTYVESMRVVGQKATVKMDPSLKRSLCSGCNTVLVPGSTASVRVKSSRSHGHIMVYTCLHCRTAKRIPSPPTAVVPTAFPAEVAGSVDHAPAPIVETLQTPSHISPAVKPKRPGKRKAPVPRPPPLFARPDAGHVLFRGNGRLAFKPEEGSGSCFG